MLLIGCFAHTIELEQALADIERSGIERSHILAVGMNAGETADPANNSDAIELGAAFATACAVIGVAAGFRLAGGPIVWGLIGAAAGFGAGYALHRLLRPRVPRSGFKSSAPEVTVIVQCPPHKSEDIRSAMYRCGALSVGTSGN